jgi:hypothetical protein
MNMAVTLYAIIVFFGFSAVNASEYFLLRPFSTPPINYDASAQKIENPLYPSLQVFNPLPKTLHELYERNNQVLEQHALLHSELFRILHTKENARTILNIFAEYGIGITYEPDEHLTTTHQGIHSTGQRICTSLDNTYKNRVR